MEVLGVLLLNRLLNHQRNKRTELTLDITETIFTLQVMKYLQDITLRLQLKSGMVQLGHLQQRFHHQEQVWDQQHTAIQVHQDQD